MIRIQGPNCYPNLGRKCPTLNRNACLNSNRECSLGSRQCCRGSLQVDRAPAVNIDFPAIHLLPKDGSFEDVCQNSRRSCTSCCKKGKTISLDSRICSLPRRRLFPAGGAECSTNDLSSNEALAAKRLCRVLYRVLAAERSPSDCEPCARTSTIARLILTSYISNGIMQTQTQAYNEKKQQSPQSCPQRCSVLPSQHSLSLSEHSRMLFRSWRDHSHRQIRY